MPDIVNRLNAAVWPWSPRQLARRALLRFAPRHRFIEKMPSASDVYLTFDDGPHPIHSPQVLDTLAEHDAHATFFVVGRKCERYPGIVRRIYDEGHSIGNHTYSHVDAATMTAPAWNEDVRRTDLVLESLLGVTPRLVRPPHGKLPARSAFALLRTQRTVVLWNVDPKDYAVSSEQELRQWLEQHPLCGGDIVLLHDVHPWAPAVLGELIASGRQRGLKFRAIPFTRDPQPNVAVSRD